MSTHSCSYDPNVQLWAHTAAAMILVSSKIILVVNARWQSRSHPTSPENADTNKAAESRWKYQPSRRRDVAVVSGTSLLTAALTCSQRHWPAHSSTSLLTAALTCSQELCPRPGYVLNLWFLLKLAMAVAVRLPKSGLTSGSDSPWHCSMGVAWLAFNAWQAHATKIIHYKYTCSKVQLARVFNHLRRFSRPDGSVKNTVLWNYS